MKRVVNKSLFLILMAISMAMATNVVLAQVYKVVDKDGNVTYTDEPPKDGSAPIKLPPLSVIEAPTYKKAPEVGEGDEEGEGGEQMSLGYLRKNYADFAIVAPKQEESVWGPDEAISVAWNTRYQLQEGMQVTIFIDGAEHATTTDQIIPVADLDRGQHSVGAQLTDAQNRNIATAEPVTFFVRRPGLYNRPQQPSPRGG